MAKSALSHLNVVFTLLASGTLAKSRTQLSFFGELGKAEKYCDCERIKMTELCRFQWKMVHFSNCVSTMKRNFEELLTTGKIQLKL